VSVSLARRLAALEAKLAALRAKQIVVVGLKDFAGLAPASESTEPFTQRLWPCPVGCGSRVRTGEARCSGCGEELAWPSMDERP
jgi:hypothetical protein